VHFRQACVESLGCLGFYEQFLLFAFFCKSVVGYTHFYGSAQVFAPADSWNPFYCPSILCPSLFYIYNNNNIKKDLYL
jgi:hypothetical protein